MTSLMYVADRSKVTYSESKQTPPRQIFSQQQGSYQPECFPIGYSFLQRDNVHVSVAAVQRPLLRCRSTSKTLPPNREAPVLHREFRHCTQRATSRSACIRRPLLGPQCVHPFLGRGRGEEGMEASCAHVRAIAGAARLRPPFLLLSMPCGKDVLSRSY